MKNNWATQVGARRNLLLGHLVDWSREEQDKVRRSLLARGPPLLGSRSPGRYHPGPWRLVTQDGWRSSVAPDLRIVYG